MTERQRIKVDDAGITVTYVSEPRLSVFGKVLHQGGVSEFASPWDEISVVWFRMVAWTPDAEPAPELTIDLTWGEFMEVHADAEGFAEAVGELCDRAGTVPPDSAEHVEIWPGG
ncbi:MAG TPA: hypothetical protein VN408_26700 [Actinoplanes sp.]|nr:hypothetical protein [Actinoplanes sp.]